MGDRSASGRLGTLAGAGPAWWRSGARSYSPPGDTAPGPPGGPSVAVGPEFDAPTTWRIWSAITGGLELALACDVLVASDRARFADTHARVGMVPGWGLTVLLPRLVGPLRARQMSFTGNFVSAPQALAWGLVNEVVAHDELLARAHAIARDIADAHRPAVRELKAMYDELGEVPGELAWSREAEWSAAWARSGRKAARRRCSLPRAARQRTCRRRAGARAAGARRPDGFERSAAHPSTFLPAVRAVRALSRLALHGMGSRAAHSRGCAPLRLPGSPERARG